MAFSHIVAISSLAAASLAFSASPRQQTGAAGPRFELVSVKPCSGEPQIRSAPGGGRGSRGVPIASPGRITLDCGTVERLINLAYVVYGERLLHNNAQIAPEPPPGALASPGTTIPWWRVDRRGFRASGSPWRPPRRA
jgi:hypothetical protein